MSNRSYYHVPIFDWSPAYVDIAVEYSHEEKEKWIKCPRCNEKPRLWIFDNGRYAKCRCFHKWDSAPVSAISIMEHVIKTNGSLVGYDISQLREAWNLYIEKGIYCV